MQASRVRMPMGSDREQILRSVRTALADVPATERSAWSPDEDHDPAAAYAAQLDLPVDARVDLFAQRCAEYRATVTRCGRSDREIAVAVAEICAKHRVGKLVAPADLPPDWLPDGVRVEPDNGSQTPAELAGYDGALTGSALAIAITGTIVLDSGSRQGRRVLSLVPDLHICVVEAARIVGGVPEAVETMAVSARQGLPITLISGPSATSDIELVRVEGVHGPRQLEVILAG